MSRKSENGITLTALVVTIIVLLILAGVTIALVTGSNGVAGRAENAVDKYNEAVTNEQNELRTVEETIDNLTNPTT